MTYCNTTVSVDCFSTSTGSIDTVSDLRSELEGLRRENVQGTAHPNYVLRISDKPNALSGRVRVLDTFVGCLTARHSPKAAPPLSLLDAGLAEAR